MTHGMWCAHAKLTTWATRVCVSLVVQHWENVTCEVCCSNKKILQSVTSEQLCEETAQRVFPSYHAALYMSFLVNCHELHQESFHCHQDVLDEEDEGCHCWYCQEGIGASRSSPDSRCRRCNYVNASLKSERSFIGSLRPDVLREIHQFFKVSKVLVLRRTIGEIFLRVLVHLDAYFFSSINAE